MKGDNKSKLDTRECQRIELVNHKRSKHKWLLLSVSFIAMSSVQRSSNCP